jgi:hypothetical protein
VSRTLPDGDAWTAWATGGGDDLSGPEGSCERVLDDLESWSQAAARQHSTFMKACYSAMGIDVRPLVAAAQFQQYAIGAWFAAARQLASFRI